MIVRRNIMKNNMLVFCNITSTWLWRGDRLIKLSHTAYKKPEHDQTVLPSFCNALSFFRNALFITYRALFSFQFWFCFADDMVILVEETREIQGMIVKLEDGMTEYGIEVNNKK